MRKIILSCLTVLSTVFLSTSVYSQAAPAGCPGVRNEQPVLDLPAQPLK